MRPYSIMTLSFHGRLRSGELGLRELLEGLAETGLEAIEPATSLFTDRADLEAELPKLAADLGLALAAYDSLANLVSPDPAARQAAIDGVKRDVDRCAAWGIPVCMVAGSRVHAELSPTESRRLVAEGMSRCAEFAAPAGVTLAIESYGVDLELHASSDQLAEVFAQCDERVRSTFDMGNFVLGGDDPLDLVPRWLPKLAHCHVKDFRRLPPDSTAGLPSRDGCRYIGCRLDEGSVHVTKVLQALRQHGYAGALSLEMSGGDDLPEVAHDLAIVQAATG
ncbi:MAG: sugar phosphate isomerase/epimerase [Armatimonadetes bacterium]|nr:sugar phosphate isomerase/epimerase [Armatimonadota bacterium]